MSLFLANCSSSTFWNKNVLQSFFGGLGLGRWTGLYKMGGFSSNCREDDNIFLYPCRKTSLSAGCFLKAGPIPSACTVEFILSGTQGTGEVQGY